LAVGAVICVQCGYDTRTRRRVGEAGARRPSPIVILGLLLVALVSAAVLYLRSLDDGVRPSPPPALPAAATAPGELSPPEPPTAAAPAAETAAPTETASPAAEGTASETRAESAPSVAASESAPTEPEIDWAELAARHRERLRAEADRRSPMFEPGESVEVRLANGLIRRGIFRGLDGDALRLEAEESETIPLDKLDRNSRLRADAAYRERYLEYLTRQRIAEMQRARERTINASPGGG
jgi:hypothetical protein